MRDSACSCADSRYCAQPLDTPAGKMDAHLYSSDRPDAFFAVGYADYPLALVVGGPPEQLFAGMRDTWTRAHRRPARHLTTAPLKLAGHYPGIEFWAKGR